jgi:hypothetical protein
MKMLLTAVVMLSAATCAAQDGLGSEPLFEIVDEPASAWRWSGELQLRGDRVTGLPGGREDLERTRLRSRWGGTWQGAGPVSYGFVLAAALGSDSNRDNLSNNDVSKSRQLAVDEAWLDWRWSASARARLGKTQLPLELSPMLWDNDLRPLGAGLRFDAATGLNRWQVDVGVFEPDPLTHDGVRVAAAQLGFHWHEGAAFSAGAQLACLDYGDADAFARAGLGRGNSLVAGRYLFDYRLLDAQE